MKYSVAQESRIGGREINQDRAGWEKTDAAVLLVVADGMGGHMQGEVAAQIATDTIRSHFRSEANPRIANAGVFLETALRLAHLTIVDYAEACRIPSHAAPRTTCIVCLIQDGIACWAHAGDSRLYLIHGQAPDVPHPPRVAHTRDHSLVQRMIDEGQISREEAARHPMRNRVFSCLGGDVAPKIEISRPIPLKNGDIIALCTDGAWAPVAESLVASLGHAPLTKSVPHLLDVAESVAGPKADNLTVIALRWEDNAPAAAVDSNTHPVETPPPADAHLSDAEIDRAIDEIRRRLAQNKPTPGASS